MEDAMALPVIFVPGTWGMDNPLDWYSPTSSFSAFLAKFDLEEPVPDRPFVWTTNIDGVHDKHWDWIAGGAALYDYIVPAIAPQDCIPASQTRVVAHSHGLQVVLYACAAGLRVNNLVSVGGPVRKDMMDIAAKAKPNIKNWLHLAADGDRMQLLGELFDGHWGIRREHPLADKNDKMPREAGHGGVLRDMRYYDLWISRGWLGALKRD